MTGQELIDALQALPRWQRDRPVCLKIDEPDDADVRIDWSGDELLLLQGSNTAVCRACQKRDTEED